MRQKAVLMGSYAGGLHPFTATDVWQLVRRRAETCGTRRFFVWHPYAGEPRSWTYADLARDAASVAAGLSKRGVRPGDRVLIHLENSPEFIISWFACAAVGAVAVTTNTRSAGDELAYYADDSAAVGAITQPRFADLVSANAPSLKWQVVTDHDGGEFIATARGDESFSSLFCSPDDLPPRPIDPMAPMSVQYTSGTTSRPKGVVWTHANALWGARVNAEHEDLHPDDRHLCYMPLFHTNALAYSMLPTMWVGADIVLVPKWSTSRFWDVSHRYGCTWLSLVGLPYRTLLTADAPPRHTYRMFGAGYCDTPLDAKYGVKTIGWWGMTETVSHGTVGNPYTPDRPMSIGRPAPEYGIKVVRADGVTPVEAEEAGQLLVKARPAVSMFAGYLNQPDATAACFDDDGWFRTGDLVVVHDDGFLSFVDRSKDMLKVGAENVAASEIERVIVATGLVREAAVVGRRDDKLDEVPVAFVVPSGPRASLESEVIAACEAHLADFKVPRAIYRVRELPRSTINKVNKVELRKVASGDAELDRARAERRWLEEARVDPSGSSVEPIE